MEAIKRSFVVGVTKGGYPVKLDVEIEYERNNEWELSISGWHNGGGGQIIDMIDPLHRDYKLSKVLVPSPILSEIISVWRTYHNNGLHAGTVAQEACLAKFEDVRAPHVDHYEWAKQVLTVNGLLIDASDEAREQLEASCCHIDFRTGKPFAPKPVTAVDLENARYTKQYDALKKRYDAERAEARSLNPNSPGFDAKKAEAVRKAKAEAKPTPGYRYGSGWLYIALPENLPDRIKAWAESAKPVPLAVSGKTLDGWIKRNRLTYTVKSVDRNPNYSDPQPGLRNYQFMITHGKSRAAMSAYFTIGSGCSDDPESMFQSLIDCIADDLESIDNTASFEEWCSDLGYDSDSRKAERIYAACKESANDIKRLVGESEYKKLLFETERL